MAKKLIWPVVKLIRIQPKRGHEVIKRYKSEKYAPANKIVVTLFTFPSCLFLGVVNSSKHFMFVIDFSQTIFRWLVDYSYN